MIFLWALVFTSWASAAFRFVNPPESYVGIPMYTIGQKLNIQLKTDNDIRILALYQILPGGDTRNGLILYNITITNYSWTVGFDDIVPGRSNLDLLQVSGSLFSFLAIENISDKKTRTCCFVLIVPGSTSSTDTKNARTTSSSSSALALSIGNSKARSTSTGTPQDQVRSTFTISQILPEITNSLSPSNETRKPRESTTAGRVDASSPHRDSTLSPGAIVAIVLGGLGFIAFFVTAVWVVRRLCPVISRDATLLTANGTELSQQENGQYHGGVPLSTGSSVQILFEYQRDATQGHRSIIAEPAQSREASMAGPEFLEDAVAEGVAEGVAVDVHNDSSDPAAVYKKYQPKGVIFVAVRSEAGAGSKVFDSVSARIPGTCQDPFTCLIGNIGKTEWVLIFLGKAGNNRASHGASWCSRHFPNIELAIVLGICGARPFIPKTDQRINLYDVIMSTGIIQHDFVGQESGWQVRKEPLIRPHPAISSNILSIQAAEDIHSAFRNSIVSHLGYLRRVAGLEPNSCITQPNGGESSGQGARSSHSHLWKDLRPAIYFGHYATGNMVVKCADYRDQILAEFDEVLGFEMEGAGICEVYQGKTIIMKSVADFADEEKSDFWHRPAAFCATAATRALVYWLYG